MLRPQWNVASLQGLCADGTVHITECQKWKKCKMGFYCTTYCVENMKYKKLLNGLSSFEYFLSQEYKKI